jgi:phosphatidylglycerophosphatase A
MLIRTILKNLATLGFVGYLPLAPGTFGTAVAVVFFAVLRPHFSVHLFLLVLITALGVIASDRAEKTLNEKDSRHIVVDEFAGYALSVLSLPLTLPFLISAFLLFRFFDILKPPPIRWIEKILPGGAGIMADDLMAGVYTNALLQVWKVLG